MSSPAKPTRAELAILRVLWTHEACTVREVHDQLSPAQKTGYTTTLKQIQVMTEKGLVTRTERGRFHVYRAKGPEDAIQKRLVRDLVDLAFGGSSGRLVLQALSSQPASPDELREIRRVLDQQEQQDARTSKKSS
jgi:BlaI family transcriptional regulator, penicillinase repressor